MQGKECLDPRSLVLHIHKNNIRPGLNEALSGVVVLNRAIFIHHNLHGGKLSGFDMARERIANLGAWALEYRWQASEWSLIAIL